MIYKKISYINIIIYKSMVSNHYYIPNYNQYKTQIQYPTPNIPPPNHKLAKIIIAGTIFLALRKFISN